MNRILTWSPADSPKFRPRIIKRALDHPHDITANVGQEFPAVKGAPGGNIQALELGDRTDDEVLCRHRHKITEQVLLLVTSEMGVTKLTNNISGK
jgi:hypothetical protein